MAVRPTAALLNHSCWPNTVRCSIGGAVVLMAAVDIKPGEEVNTVMMTMLMLIALTTVDDNGNDSDDCAVDTVALLVVPSLLLLCL